ncbi:MAG: PepSY domain-containing protein [Gemmatimonadales bacterium]
MSRRGTFGLAIAALLLAAGSLAAQDVKVKETKPGLLKRAKITSEQAIATAKAKLPNAKLDAGEIEEEDGKLIYSFDFKTAGKTGVDEVNVDAMTGKIVSVAHETPEDEAKEAKADKDKAAKKAVKKP